MIRIQQLHANARKQSLLAALQSPRDFKCQGQLFLLPSSTPFFPHHYCALLLLATDVTLLKVFLYTTLLALNSLQKMYGRFPRILGKGDYTSRLATLLAISLPDQPSPSSDTSARSTRSSLWIAPLI
ncbi:hypothetical protein EDD22DRAFT_347904 [Suillus occidentalis]|nr:hypothetical protein EDD22DRAFT_347904 [Suillus occidentalis]